MGWDDVVTLWGDSNVKDKVSSTFKARVEDTGNNVDVDDGHTDGHVDTCTWSDVVSRCMTRGRNMQLLWKTIFD